MRRVAIINQKGGVGKTTTTINLGAALAQSGKRVLLIDLDPQGHLSLHLGCEPADGQTSVYDVLTSAAPIAESLVTVNKRLTLLPADIDLAGAEAELISVTGREVLLREALATVADRFDFMLIDCPPSLGVLTINALVATDEVLIPLQAQFFALQGLSRLFDTVSLVRQRINPALRVAGVALCMHESSTKLSSEVVDDLTQFLESSRGTAAPWSQARLFKTRIRRNIKLAEASSFGQSVFDYAPKSNGALDYADLAHEIFGTRPELGSMESPKVMTAEAAPTQSVHAPAVPTVAAVVPSPPPSTKKAPRRDARGKSTSNGEVASVNSENSRLVAAASSSP